MTFNTTPRHFMTRKWEAQSFTSTLHYRSPLISDCIYLAGSLLDKEGHKEAFINAPLPKL